MGAHTVQTVRKQVLMRHWMSIRDIFVLQMKNVKFITVWKNLIAFPMVNSLKLTIKATTFNIFLTSWFLL